MPYGNSTWFVRFFFDFRRQIASDFGQLFEESGNETTGGLTLQSKWGWYNVLYGLSNDNVLNIGKITLLPIREVFTYLAYCQDYNNTKNNNYGNIK